jgi:hypothetical protein
MLVAFQLMNGMQQQAAIVCDMDDYFAIATFVNSPPG